MQASEVSSTLFNNLSFRAERQKVISSNIANMNTPDYKTKELVFDDEVKKVQDKNNLALAVTHNKHISKEISENMNRDPYLIEVENLQEQNDGNNVSLDQQMGNLAKNNMIFAAIQSSIKKDSKMFKSVIESSAKN